LRAAAAALLLTLVSAAGGAQAAQPVRIAEQYGIAYLPLMVIKERGLLERFARQAGVGELNVTWWQFSSAAAMNDALLSGGLDLASGGIAPLITLWARTAASLKVRGVATLGSMPNDLNTNRVAVKTVADFGAADRIALPAVSVSIQAIMLQMAAEHAFGSGQQGKLDALTVSMSHPDGLAALLSGRLEVSAHFTSPPFQQQELADPHIHRVLSSYDIVGGPHTFNVVWCATRFHDDNPKLMGAFLAALDDAMAFIKNEPDAAAALYLRSEKSNLSADFVHGLITAPENHYTAAPENSMAFATFQNRIGLIKRQPESWKDLFFPELHDRAGS
jgi:NitT/TauT family transport system substrate-binding protein